MTGEDAKRFSRFVEEEHRLNGGGVFSFKEGEPLALLVTEGEQVVPFSDLTVAREGKTLRVAQDVRGLLHRVKEGADANLLDREDFVLWSLYDEEANTSVLGVGVMAMKEVPSG